MHSVLPKDLLRAAGAVVHFAHTHLVHLHTGQFRAGIAFGFHRQEDQGEEVGEYSHSVNCTADSVFVG